MPNSPIDPPKEIRVVASAFILVDADGNPWGPFLKGSDAAIWAMKKWPDQQEATIDDDGEQTGKGWAVWALRHPDT